MGHIELAAPVSHIWYFKGIPSRIGLVLDITPRNLEKVLYFAKYIVTDPGDTELKKKQILSEKEYLDMREKYEDDFKAGMGAEAIKELLCEIDVDALTEQLREELSEAEKRDWLSRSAGLALGSDAFFPFGDNIERARRSGVTAIVEPGGSIRDGQVIETCDKYGFVLAFNGIRLFHH